MNDKEEANNLKEVTKICGICGDKALGYNFNAITCESCKAFFRRNALRNKEFKCPFDGNCKVDLITRRFCQKCRLKKCFDIGMKKEWILSDEEKQIKRNKIAENRRKRQCVNKISKVADSTTNISPNLIQMIQNRYNSEESSLGNDSHFTPIAQPNCLTQDIQFNSFRKLDNEIISSSSEPYLKVNEGYDCVSNKMSFSFQKLNTNYDSINDTLIENPLNNECEPSTSHSSPAQSKTYTEDIVTNNSVANQLSQIEIVLNDSIENMQTSPQMINDSKNAGIESFDQNYPNIKTEICQKEAQSIPDIVFERTIEVEFAQIPIREAISETNSSNIKELNPLEKMRLNELSIAANILKDPLVRITSEATGIEETFKMCDQLIRKLIKMTKKINAFKSLCQHDQIALLKAGSTEIIILRGVISFNFEREFYTFVTDSNNATLVKLDILKQAKSNVYEVHRNFMLSFRKEWDKDQHILYLLMAILLFTPTRPNTLHKDLIKLEQQTYIYLLQRYLETKYSSKCEAKTRYLRFMSILEELHILNEEHVRLYLDIDPKDVGPLLVEIFDLKP